MWTNTLTLLNIHVTEVERLVDFKHFGSDTNDNYSTQRRTGMPSRLTAPMPEPSLPLATDFRKANIRDFTRSGSP